MRVIDTRMVLGLSVWILGFALMTAGWLIGELFESWGTIPSKILYKLGAIIVATPVIVLLWRVSRYLYTNRVAVVILVNDAFRFICRRCGVSWRPSWAWGWGPSCSIFPTPGDGVWARTRGTGAWSGSWGRGLGGM